MKHAQFIQSLDEQRIVAAIKNAEANTSGEIRVLISTRNVADPLKAAEAQFIKLGMTHTRHRNGVLLFIAPRSQTFAVIGDHAIHTRCGDSFWQSVAGEMERHFQAGSMTESLVHGITKAGEVLAQHFPRDPDDPNELPDRVERDGTSS